MKNEGASVEAPFLKQTIWTDQIYRDRPQLAQLWTEVSR